MLAELSWVVSGSLICHMYDIVFSFEVLLILYEMAVERLCGMAVISIYRNDQNFCF